MLNFKQKKWLKGKNQSLRWNFTKIEWSTLKWDIWLSWIRNSSPVEYHPIIISLAINNAEHFKAKLICELDLNKKMLSFRLFDLQADLFFYSLFYAQFCLFGAFICGLTRYCKIWWSRSFGFTPSLICVF